MSAIRKAGIEFKPGIGVSPDLTGLASTFSAKYKEIGDTSFTDITGSWAEENDGTYRVPVTFPTAGDYLLIMESTDPRIENLEGNVVVTAANIDDVKVAIDALRTVADTIAADVDGLDGNTLAQLETDVANIKTLLDDGDATTRNSVLEFLQDIDAAISNGGSGLSALAGFTDDVENMLMGTEFLADGTTSNPFYDAANPGVAKESTVLAAVATLQTDITNAVDAINLHSDANKDLIISATTAIKTVVDANAGILGDAAFGNEALKTLIDNVLVAVNDNGGDNDDVLAILNDASNGLAAIKTAIMDKLAIIDGKIDNISSATGSRMFI